MIRLIDASILFEEVGNIKPKNKSEYELLGKFMNMITNSTTVERRLHGEWIDTTGRNDLVCSVCKHKAQIGCIAYCGSCGADMRKSGEAE